MRKIVSILLMIALVCTTCTCAGAVTQEETVLKQSAQDPPIQCETVYYQSDGINLAIDIYRPNEEKYPGSRPGILFFFGGGFYIGTRQAFREQAKACANQGYVAMSADYRISAVHNTRAEDSILDGTRAWDYVRSNAAQWNLNPEKIVLAGGSAGGTIACMCGPLTGVFPQALVLFNPGILDDEYPDATLSKLVGKEMNGVAVTNVNSVEPGCPPVLVMHGEADTTVHFSSAQKFVEHAQSEGVDAKLVSYPGMTHGFFNFFKNRTHYYLTVGELLGFLEKVNPSRGILTVKQDGTGHYKTIQAAVNAAQPGDTVEVYAGVYREQVIFPRGGTDEAHRITLKSHDGDSVTVTGSNVVSGWRKVDGHDGVWTVTLDKDCFTTDVLGNYFNPYANQWQSKVRGFYPSCGCIYVNGIPMDEAHSLKNTTLNQTDSKGTVTTLDVAGLYDTKNTWMAEVDKETGITKILANFGTVNPNAAGVLVESNTRKQVITAAWNSGYITIDGIRVTNGSGPKTINFAQLGSKSMAGALSTHGGHHWIIENCDLSYNRGVALDFGLGSRGYMYDMCGYPSKGENPDPEPDLYGYHIIRNNYIHNNMTNGAMAYRGAYTEIYNNILSNNDDMNTALASEGYIKNVNSGYGINIHDNYFYSDHDWDTRAIWYDTEVDGSSITNNIFFSNGPDGKGFSFIMWEDGNGWALCNNNVFVNVGFRNATSSSVLLVNNLFLNNTKRADFPGSNVPAKAYGWDGYSRSLRAKYPGTLETICLDGDDGNSHFQTYCRFNKMLNNIFFTQGLNSNESMADCSDADYNNKYYEFINDVNYEDFTTDNVDPDKFTGLAADNWTPVTPNYAEDASRAYGNECDYNVYYGGAAPISYQYGEARSYVADANSKTVNGGSYTVEGDETSFKLTLNMDNSIYTVNAPSITSELLGQPGLYKHLGVDFPVQISNTDYFGNERTKTTVVGPFAVTKSCVLNRMIGTKETAQAKIEVAINMN